VLRFDVKQTFARSGSGAPTASASRLPVQSLSVSRAKRESPSPLRAMDFVIVSSRQRRTQLQDASTGELVRCGEALSF
jgi:hypothetical protein